MFRAICRVELLSLWRERGVWIALLGFALLAGYAALTGAAEARGVVRDQQALLADEEARLAKLKQEVQTIAAGGAVRHAEDPRDPHLVGRSLGRRVAALPVGELSSIAVGQRDLLPQSMIVTSEARLGDAGADDAGSLARRVTGSFDLAFVLVYLLPLLVIVLTFDLLAGERERGTLAMLLSQPISLQQLVLGKAAARGLLLLGVVVLVFGLPLGLSGGASVGRAGLYLALLLSYVGFWFALALCVNAYGRTSAGNALALVTVWLGLVVVLPGLASVIVDTLHPTPSRVELVNRARDAARDAEAEVSAIEGDHGVPKTDARAAAPRAVEVQAELESRVEPVVKAFAVQLGRQQALVDRLRFASPAIVAYEGLNDIAGSGVLRHQHYSESVERYHEEYKRFYFERIRAGKELSASDYDALPSYRYQEPALGRVASRIGFGLLGLLLPALGLLFAASIGFRRYLSHGLR